MFTIIQSNKIVKNESRLLQYLAMLSGTLLTLTSGINLGWSSPYLPYMRNPDSPYDAPTSSEGSWCAVMPLVGAPLGAFLAALLVDRIGRKNVILCSAPIIAMCFITMAFARTILVLCIARFIIGSTEGALYTSLPIYLGEIADPKIRGFISSSISVSALSGVIFINILGPIASITSSSLICLFVPVLHFVTFFWMPESPYFLIMRGEHKQAKRSLSLLRGTDDIEKEFELISSAVKRQGEEKTKLSDLFTIGSNRKACYIYLTVICCNKFSGMNPVIFYTTTIFENANGILDPVWSVILFSIVGLLSTIVALCIVDKFGRRPLILFSAFGCSIALAAEASYFTIQDFYPDLAESLGWLPVIALVAYNVIFSFGLSFGPVLLLSEIFPTSVKANALSIADTISVILGTIASKFFVAIADISGMLVPFWTFSACTLLGGILIYFTLPETKGKTLEEIQVDLIGIHSVKIEKKAKHKRDI